MAHAAKDFELDLEKFDGNSFDFDFGFRNNAGGDEAHSFDRIFAWAILDLLGDFAFATDYESRSANALNVDTKFLEVKADILHHVVGTSAYDCGFAREERCCHDGVLGDGVATFDEDDFFVGIIDWVDCGFVKSRITDGINFEAEEF